MSEKQITLTRHQLFNLILRYENEVTCAKELPVFLDRVMEGDKETAEIGFDAQGKPGERFMLLSDGLLRCCMCGDFFHVYELREIIDDIDGQRLMRHICKRCDSLEHNYEKPKEGERDRKAE